MPNRNTEGTVYCACTIYAYLELWAVLCSSYNTIHSNQLNLFSFFPLLFFCFSSFVRFFLWIFRFQLSSYTHIHTGVTNNSLILIHLMQSKWRDRLVLHRKQFYSSLFNFYSWKISFASNDDLLILYAKKKKKFKYIQKKIRSIMQTCGRKHQIDLNNVNSPRKFLLHIHID